MEGVEKTLKDIEARHLERQQKSWTCRSCQKEQEPPPVDDWLCSACRKTALKTAKEHRLTLVDGYMRASGVPPIFMKFQKSLPQMDWIEEYGVLGQEKGLCLMGPSGVGKSVHAVLIMRHWLTQWAKQEGLNIKTPDQWKFVCCANLVMRLQDAWHSGEDSAYKVLKSVSEVPHLILDDLGTEKPTEFVKQSIYFLINEREQWQRQTIITTNFTLEDVDRQYDARISSRIAGMCDIRELRGKDRRVEK